MIALPQKRSVPPAVLEALGVLHLDPVNLLYQGFVSRSTFWIKVFGKMYQDDFVPNIFSDKLNVDHCCI